MKYNETSSDIDKLRSLVNWCNCWNEGFNQRWTIQELVKLHAFAMSKQGGQIDETAHAWPNWLTRAILKLPVGKPLDEKTFARAKALEL